MGRVGTELLKEHEAPDSAAVLRRVAGTRFDPEAFRVLGVENPLDGISLYRPGEGIDHLGIDLCPTHQTHKSGRLNRRARFLQQPGSRIAVEMTEPHVLLRHDPTLGQAERLREWWARAHANPH